MLFYDDELPLKPIDGEGALVERLGSAAVIGIDDLLRHHVTHEWSKVARVLVDALEAAAHPPSNDSYVHLYLRRLIALVESGEIEAQGNLRNPRRSEVRLRDDGPRSEPRSSTPLRINQLRAAVDAGDLDQVKELLARGASVLEPDQNGWLPLHWAARSNSSVLVRFFARSGSPLEARATDQWTALHLACISGSSRAVAALVRAGADVDSVARGGNTPLHIALVPRKLRTVKILLLAGADPTLIDDKGRTPNAVARAQGLLEIASLIEACSHRRGLTQV